MPLATTPICKKLRWLTHILQKAQELVGASKSSMRASITPRRYVGHVALVSSNCEPFGCLEKRCDALMEECDVWQIVVDPITATNTDLQIAALGELQREMTNVGENTFLVKREC